MTDEADERKAATGGETGRPAGAATGSRLSHAPGDRYVARRPSDGAGGASGMTAAGALPRIGHALVYGVATLGGAAAVWSLAAGLLDITWGLVVIAALAGWAVGTAVLVGAWGYAAHAPDVRVRGIAVALAVATWLVSSFGGYLVALAVLQGSTAGIAERIANAPFGDALAAQFSLFDVAEIGLLAVFAWRSAR